MAAVPADAPADAGWRAFRVAGPLDFSLTGVLLAVVQPLAEAGVSIFALSTYTKSPKVCCVAASILKQAQLIKGRGETGE